MSRSAALTKDVIAGIVVFQVALPLCLGIAMASNADPFSGIVSGIIGGIVVGMLSGSHTSVSGPAAGLTAVVAVQIATLGSFEAFLACVRRRCDSDRSGMHQSGNHLCVCTFKRYQRLAFGDWCHPHHQTIAESTWSSKSGSSCCGHYG